MNNLAPPSGVEFASAGHCGGDGSQEHQRTIASPNSAVADVERDENKAVNDLKLRRLIQKYRRIDSAKHNRPPRPLGGQGNVGSFSKLIKHFNTVNARLIDASPSINGRRCIPSRAAPTPVPANDNDDWSDVA